MTIEIPVKILEAVCGRCGGDVIGDNMGTGRPWQHVDRLDDHPIIFGTPAPPDIIARPATLDDLEEVLEAEVVEELPPPGHAREALDDEIPTGARRMRTTAHDNGFETVVKIVTGPIVMAKHHDPRGFRFVDSLLVGFRHPDGRAALAIWERQETEDAFKYQWCMHPGSGGLSGSADLKAYLKQE